MLELKVRAEQLGLRSAPAQLEPAPWVSLTRVVSLRALLMCAIAAIFLVLYLLAYPRSFGEQTFNSPRENVGYLLSEQFAQGEGFSYPLQHYDELPPDIARALTPRDAASLEGDVVPKDFAGTMLFHAPFFFLWEPLVLIITPLFAVLSAFVLAKIGEELFSKRVGLAAFVLWLAYPPLLINASYIFTSDTVALFAMLSGALFFIRFWRGRAMRDYLIMAAAFGLALVMRYPNLIAISVFALALFEARRLSVRHALLGLAVIAPFAALVLGFNRIVYGGFTVTGFHLASDLLAETANFSSESFFKFRPEVIAGYLRMYAVEWPVLLVPQVAGLAVGLAVAWRRPDLRAIVLVLLGANLALGLYYLPQDAWGWTDPQVNASLLRYLLPSLAITTMFLVHGLFSLVERRPAIVVAPLAVLLAAYGWTAWSGPAAVQETRQVVAQVADLRDDIVDATEPDAIIATRIMDKVIFPERQTLTMTYLLDEEEPLHKGRGSTWQFLPAADRLADVAVRVYEAGVPIYLLADYDWRVAKDYDEALRPLGYRLRHMRTSHPEFEEVGFYKVVPLEAEAG